MPLNMISYVKQFLTFFSLKLQENSVSCNLSMCRSNIAKNEL